MIRRLENCPPQNLMTKGLYVTKFSYIPEMVCEPPGLQAKRVDFSSVIFGADSSALTRVPDQALRPVCSLYVPAQALRQVCSLTGFSFLACRSTLESRNRLVSTTPIGRSRYYSFKILSEVHTLRY